MIFEPPPPPPPPPVGESAVGYATKNLLAEIIRRECTAPESGESQKTITVRLAAINEGVSRARASAVFTVQVDMSWRAKPIVMIDSLGYLVREPMAKIVQWLEKSLSGKQSTLSIVLGDASRLPAKWTAGRVAALAAKIAHESPAQVRQSAGAKYDSVVGWDDSPRRAAVLGAVDAMLIYADLLESVQAATVPPV